MLRYSMDMFLQQKLGGPSSISSSSVAFEAGLPTPSFSMAGDKKKQGASKKKMNFDDESVMKAL
jgi:hypothetical protein